MKILAISDVEAKYYYDFYVPGRLREFDLIIACGDLRRPYLEFLATMARCPLLYVHGNHDDAFESAPPEGCICIDDKIYVHNGVRIMGLGGSYRYREGRHMFTEGQMRRRIRRMRFSIWRNQGFDILVTHAPARHINDMDSLSHRGFECFGSLIERYHPKYFVHGHIHRSYGINIPRKTISGETTIINAFEYCVFEY